MKQLIKQVGEIFGNAGVSYSEHDVRLLIAVANQFNRAGYKLTYNECAKFLMNKKNRKLIEKDGLTKTIQAMASMRLGTITRDSPKIGRNDKCTCGSVKKYKHCCINKS